MWIYRWHCHVSKGRFLCNASQPCLLVPTRLIMYSHTQVLLHARYKVLQTVGNALSINTAPTKKPTKVHLYCHSCHNHSCAVLKLLLKRIEVTPSWKTHWSHPKLNMYQLPAIENIISVWTTHIYLGNCRPKAGFNHPWLIVICPPLHTNPLCDYWTWSKTNSITLPSNSIPVLDWNLHRKWREIRQQLGCIVGNCFTWEHLRHLPPWEIPPNSGWTQKMKFVVFAKSGVNTNGWR